VGHLALLSVAASGIRPAGQLLNSMLRLAVDAGYLPTNPIEGVRVPRHSDAEMLFLDANDVERLATAMRGDGVDQAWCSRRLWPRHALASGISWLAVDTC
jgi:hypothetical protein